MGSDMVVSPGYPIEFASPSTVIAGLDPAIHRFE
jgi:hypothetical protein